MNKEKNGPITRTPKIFLLLGISIIVATISGALFALVSHLTSDSSMAWKQDWSVANTIVTIIISGITYSGIIAGLYGYIFIRSDTSYKYGMMISRGLNYAWISVLILTIPRNVFSILYYDEIGMSGWDTAQSAAWEIVMGLFFCGVLFAFAFLVLRKGDPINSLFSEKNDGKFKYPCPKCNENVQSDWVICPICKEPLGGEDKLSSDSA